MCFGGECALEVGETFRTVCFSIRSFLTGPATLKMHNTLSMYRKMNPPFIFHRFCIADEASLNYSPASKTLWPGRSCEPVGYHARCAVVNVRALPTPLLHFEGSITFNGV